MAAVRASLPHDYVLRHEQLLSFARRVFDTVPDYVHPEGYTFRLPPDLSDWQANNLMGPFEVSGHCSRVT